MMNDYVDDFLAYIWMLIYLDAFMTACIRSIVYLREEILQNNAVHLAPELSIQLKNALT